MITLRNATPSDAGKISKLISGLTEKFIAYEFTPAGTEELLHSMAPDAIEKYIRSGYEYHVAEMDARLIGVVAVRGNSHLYHLFVAEKFQNRGIAGQLWRVAMKSCLAKGNPGVFTVNSSRYARPVYEKLGFVVQSGPQEKNGVIYIPMKLSIESPQ